MKEKIKARMFSKMRPGWILKLRIALARHSFKESKYWICISCHFNHNMVAIKVRIFLQRNLRKRSPRKIQESALYKWPGSRGLWGGKRTRAERGGGRAFWRVPSVRSQIKQARFKLCSAGRYPVNKLPVNTVMWGQSCPPHKSSCSVDSPMLSQCWAGICDAGPALTQHWADRLV